MYYGKLETSVFKRTDIDYIFIETSHHGAYYDELARFAPYLINEARQVVEHIKKVSDLDVCLWTHCKNGSEDLI